MGRHSAERCKQRAQAKVSATSGFVQDSFHRGETLVRVDIRKFFFIGAMCAACTPLAQDSEAATKGKVFGQSGI
jgi:hypothetical protein